ncbi:MULTISPECIES: Dps family protein [unclassified Rhizobium]|uniref:Dps family protein n=1 Tax=unclassified Rhizobium TaxID=2613769 RepID=UPI001AD9F45E|nr:MULTISPECIES: DNA starvation/stationary phase protection protein [unclassified Rhizobium]MBO9127974.1 DNA starvation/stationary phase protection protein [Rhizobium sp. 16-488-2b]MBO9178551.1 DNA starvation/stationary phase protection protein [Rhizobium sp. 16-488-2a]
MDQTSARTIREAPLNTPTDLGQNARNDISGALTALLADVFTLYLKTKNFHWHLSGPHFRDFHLMLDDQADQLIGMTDAIAERARKVGGMTLRSVGHIARIQRLLDNDADFVTAEDMLAELKSDNEQLIGILRQLHELTSEHRDVATTSLVEGWVDDAEGRVWFLFESNRNS